MAMNVPKYIRIDKDIAEGHYVRFTFSVHQFASIPSWQFEKEYRTYCSSTPSSWKVIIKGSSNTCSVTLSRNDCLYTPLDAYVWISCFDVLHRRLALPKVFAKRQILPDGELQGRMKEMVPRVELVILQKQELIVELSVFVGTCHKSAHSESSDLCSDLNQLQLSKF